MTETAYRGIGFVSVAVGSAVAAWLVRRWAESRDILDHPNERSSHSRPTPRGGGLVIVAAVMAGVAVMSFARPASSLWSAYVAGAAAIAAVSWLDDLRGVGSAVRLAVHFAAAVPLAWLAAPVVVHLPGFDSGVARFLGFLMAVLWLVWLTNAYNFMDGIDALAGGQAVVAGVALAVAAGHDGDLWLAVLPGIIAAASAGFLTQNWPPARIFMGDVGSAFLGYSFAAFGLIGAASSRAIVSLTALALWPFLFDTAFTLVGRARRGENLLEAHRGHLYQRLVRAGYSHEAVTVSYLTLSVGGALLGLGISFGWPGADVAAAVVVMAAASVLWGWVRLVERSVPEATRRRGRA